MVFGKEYDEIEVTAHLHRIGKSNDNKLKFPHGHSHICQVIISSNTRVRSQTKLMDVIVAIDGKHEIKNWTNQGRGNRDPHYQQGDGSSPVWSTFVHHSFVNEQNPETTSKGSDQNNESLKLDVESIEVLYWPEECYSATAEISIDKIEHKNQIHGRAKVVPCAIWFWDPLNNEN